MSLKSQLIHRKNLPATKLIVLIDVLHANQQKFTTSHAFSGLIEICDGGILHQQPRFGEYFFFKPKILQLLVKIENFVAF